MIDYTRSYSATWRVYRVNPDTWADGEPLTNVVSGSISVTKDCSGDAPRLESGSMDVTGAIRRGYYRIAMIAQQDGETERQDIATLLFEASDGTSDKGVTTYKVDGQSVLYPAYTQLMISGEYAPEGSDGAQYAARLLRRCIKAPVSVEGGFVLGRNVVHDFGARILDAVWQVLDAGGYVMQIHGDGSVHILQRPTKPTLALDVVGAELLTPGVKRGSDTSDVPNRYIAEDELERAIVVNDDPTSPVSTASRGYIYDELDESPCPVDGETLERYARRRLEELSTLYETREYGREWVAGIYPFDLAKGSDESIGIEGNVRIEAQSIQCSHGAYVTERATHEVMLWQA